MPNWISLLSMKVAGCFVEEKNHTAEMSSSTALAEAAMLQMRALQRRSLVMWSTPLVSFLVMIIFKKQVSVFPSTGEASTASHRMAKSYLSAN